MGLIIGGDAAKSGNNTHLLVVLHMRQWQKIGVPNLKMLTQFNK